MTSESNMEIRVIDNADDLEGMLSSWQRLDRRHPPETAYLSPDFMIPWLRYVQPRRPLSIVVISDNGKVTAIAPLVSDMLEAGPFRFLRLSTAGFGEAAPTLDVRTYEGRARQVVYDLLTHKAPGSRPWSLMALRHLGGNSPFLRFLPDACRELGLGLIWEPARRESYLRMEGDWQHYLERLPKKHRNELTRGFKNIDRMPDWNLSLDWPSEDNVPRVMADYQGILSRSWKTGELDSPGLHDFRQDVFARFARRGDLLVSRLQGPDGPGAMLFTFREGAGLFAYIMAYAQDCPLRGAGTLLLGHTIAHAYEKKAAIYDFSTGGDHIIRWFPMWRNTWNVYIVRRTPVGLGLRFILNRRRRQRKSSP